MDPLYSKVYSIPQYLNVREEVKLQAYNRFMGLSHPIKQVGAFIFIPFNVHKIFIIKQMLKRFYIIQWPADNQNRTFLKFCCLVERFQFRTWCRKWCPPNVGANIFTTSYLSITSYCTSHNLFYFQPSRRVHFFCRNKTCIIDI